MKEIKLSIDEMVLDAAEGVGLLGQFEGVEAARDALRRASAHLKTASLVLAEAILAADAVEGDGGEAPEGEQGAPLADATGDGGETVDDPADVPEAPSSEDRGGVDL